MKFTKDTIEEVKKGIKKSAIETRQQMDMAYDVKKKEIESDYIPQSAMDALTPEQVVRSEKIGIYLGICLILALLAYIVVRLIQG